MWLAGRLLVGQHMQRRELNLETLPASPCRTLALAPSTASPPRPPPRRSGPRLPTCSAAYAAWPTASAQGELTAWTLMTRQRKTEPSLAVLMSWGPGPGASQVCSGAGGRAQQQWG